MSVRIALVGCGDIVKRYYLPALKQMSGEGKIWLAACCDIISERAGEAASDAGFEKVYTDCMQMLRETRPDGILMALPVERTAQQAIEAAPLGIPMMLEKPPALTKVKALELSGALKKHGILHQIAFNRHFIPVAVSLKEKLGNERVRNIQIQMSRIKRVEKTFYTTAVHAIDLLRYLADAEYTQVSYSYQDLPEYGSGVSNFYLNCSFANGITGQITILVDGGIVNERVIASCKGTTYYASLPVWECSDSPGGIVVYRGDSVIFEEKGPATGEPLENAVASGFYGEIENFVRAVETRRQPQENMEFALPLIEISEKLHNREKEYRKC